MQRVASGVCLLAALACYVVGYYQLANPVRLLSGNIGPGTPPVVAQERIGGPLTERLFLPMNLIDHRLRPAWWAGFPATPLRWNDAATSAPVAPSGHP